MRRGTNKTAKEETGHFLFSGVYDYQALCIVRIYHPLYCIEPLIDSPRHELTLYDEFSYP